MSHPDRQQSVPEAVLRSVLDVIVTSMGETGSPEAIGSANLLEAKIIAWLETAGEYLPMISGTRLTQAIIEAMNVSYPPELRMPFIESRTSIGPVEVAISNGMVKIVCHEHIERLTPQQSAVMRILLQYPNQVISRPWFFEALRLGRDDTKHNRAVLRQIVFHLREIFDKLIPELGHISIQTARSEGLYFNLEGARALAVASVKPDVDEELLAEST